MEDLSSVKRALLAYIQRKHRVELSELKQWALENEVGLLTLYLALMDLIQDRQRNLSLGPPESLKEGVVNVMGKEIELKLPRTITYQPESKRRVARQGKVRQAKGQRTLMDVLGGLEARQEGGKAEASKATEVPQPKQVQQIQENQQPTQPTTEKAPQPSEPPKGAAEEVEVAQQVQESEHIEPTHLTAGQLAKILSTELGIDDATSMKIIQAVGQYLNRYWSVGLLRLLEDTSKGLDPAIIQKALKVFERLGFIDLIEPGVVNRRRDVKFPVPDTKISELL